MSKSVNSRPSNPNRASTDNHEEVTQWLTPRPYFIPKDQLIHQEEVANQLAVNLHFSEEPILLKGMEGSGKRCLVQQYIARYEAQFQYIIWIPCSHNFVEDFVGHPQLLQYLDVRFPADLPLLARFRHVMRALRLLEGATLLVLTNFNKKYADTNLLGLLPKGENWQTLITSRYELPFCKMMDMPLMNEADASQLFYQDYQAPIRVAEVGKIVSELEYHPLSISIAARYAAFQQLETKTLLDELAQIMEDMAPVNFSISKRVYYKTFQRAFAFIAGFLPAEEKVDHNLLLQILATLPTVPISFQYLLELVTLEKQRLREVLDDLTDWGWCMYEKEGDTYQLHALLGMIVIHKRRPTVSNLSPFLTYLLHAFESRGGLVLNLNRSFALLSHLYQKTEQVIRVQYATAKGYQQLGAYDKAVRLFRLAVNSAKDETYPQLSAWKNNLALLEQQVGNEKVALQLLLETLRQDLEEYGASHPITTTTQSNLALLYRQLGDIAKSKKLLKKVFEIDRQQLGDDHEKCLINRVNLATVYLDLQEVGRAMVLLENVLAHSQKKSLFVNAARLVAFCYAQKGEVVQAVYWMEQVLKGNQERLGVWHPQTAKDKANLAYFYQLKGDTNTALDLIMNALQKDIVNFGKRSLVVANRYLQLAHLYLQMDDWDKTREALLYAYKIRKLLLGKEHVETLEVKELLW